MSDSPVNFLYYCKICSEEIGKSIDLEGFTTFVNKKRVNVVQNISQLKINIIKNTFYIINSFINFNNIIIKNNQIIYNIADTIYPFIQDIEINLLKSKMSNEDNNILLLKIKFYYLYFCYYCIFYENRT